MLVIQEMKVVIQWENQVTLRPRLCQLSLHFTLHVLLPPNVALVAFLHKQTSKRHIHFHSHHAPKSEWSSHSDAILQRASHCQCPSLSDTEPLSAAVTAL